MTFLTKSVISDTVFVEYNVTDLTGGKIKWQFYSLLSSHSHVSYLE